MDPPSPLVRPFAARDVSGITLHVQSGGDNSPEALTFHKSITRVVTIGRRSRESLPVIERDRARFRCPVISRSHAKITFTEYGNAYIMDLHSHHGTHILRPGESVSRPIEAEAPTVLADGDIITFGKSVGHGPTLVRPVSVRVQLLFGTNTVFNPSMPHNISSSVSEKASPTESSGRYGVYILSDSSSSVSGSESPDVEEVSSSQPNDAAQKAPGMLETLRLLPLFPLRLSCSSDSRSRSSSPVRVIATPQIEEPAEDECSDMSQSSESELDEGADAPRESSMIGEWPRSLSPPNSPMREYNLQLSVDEHASEESDSVKDDFPPFEPLPFGILPDSYDHDVHIVDMGMPPRENEESEANVELNENMFPEPEPLRSVFTRSPTPAVRKSVLRTPSPEAASPQPDKSLTELDNRISEVCDDIAWLRMLRREDEERFEKHVQETKQRLVQLGTQMEDISALVDDNVVQRETLESNMSERMKNIQESVLRLQEKFNAIEEEREKTKAADAEKAADLSSIKDIFADMKRMHETSERRMVEQFEAIRAMRRQAKADVAHALAQVSAISTANSLKRKRAADDEDGAEEGGAMMGTRRWSRPLKRKRAMQYVGVIAKMTTAAALGAATAWTALAFA
ncbi:uncharacterized protein LAESUDRAFT_729570 [Laetiporus sulphureus 93-53]|uniref:FHA domain-containing protein n=1 Tax=Laetiporus sulphureus 93-53 TaxID=1314785 RepID=A0A165CM85_9APHY|nr:uncharacterized protein LAESUDRAFT_729570 [Laetiporus sulphureus 93-53]KZT03062.1 hypothetical protein LAESUDRAFT_729570 [Laetiporus sulphureus 93-53]